MRNLQGRETLLRAERQGDALNRRASSQVVSHLVGLEGEREGGERGPSSTKKQRNDYGNDDDNDNTDANQRLNPDAPKD